MKLHNLNKEILSELNDDANVLVRIIENKECLKIENKIDYNYLRCMIHEINKKRESKIFLFEHNVNFPIMVQWEIEDDEYFIKEDKETKESIVTITANDIIGHFSHFITLEMWVETMSTFEPVTKEKLIECINENYCLYVNSDAEDDKYNFYEEHKEDTDFSNMSFMFIYRTSSLLRIDPINMCRKAL